MKKNSVAIYYLNKLVGLEIEARRLRAECESKTGVKVCEPGTWFDLAKQSFYLQTNASIEKLGLPVEQKANYKQTQINGYYIVEV